MSKKRRIPLLCLGVGKVGDELLRQLLHGGGKAARRKGFSLVPVVIADSGGALVNADGFSGRALRTVLETVKKGGRLEERAGYRSFPPIDEIYQPNMILIDMTASGETREVLSEALDVGCGVVLANKIPLAGPWEQVQALFKSPHVRYECTVGDGLPVVESIHSLCDTGDEIRAVEGCLSGTLGYLCAALERGVAFSDAVDRAREKGYTEPDPREDLGGHDVAR